MTKVVFSVAQTRTNIPAPSTILEAIFFAGFKEDVQSIGMGISIKYISVEALAANEVQTMGLDMAGWQWSGSERYIVSINWLKRLKCIGLTAGIWVDLPVLMERQARDHNRNDRRERCSNNKSKPHQDLDSISPAESVLHR